MFFKVFIDKNERDIYSPDKCWKVFLIVKLVNYSKIKECKEKPEQYSTSK